MKSEKANSNEPPRYMDGILRLYRERPVLHEPGLHHIVVRHDDWCALLRGVGECNCDPDVEYVATKGRN